MADLTIWTIAYAILAVLVIIAVMLIVPLPLRLRRFVISIVRKYQHVFVLGMAIYGALAYTSFKQFRENSMDIAKSQSTIEKMYYIMGIYHRNQRNFYIGMFGFVLSLMIYRLVTLLHQLIEAQEQVAAHKREHYKKNLSLAEADADAGSPEQEDKKTK